MLASAAGVQRIAAPSARCTLPAPDRGAVPLLTPLEPQVLPTRTVVLVDSPIALASSGAPGAN